MSSFENFSSDSDLESRNNTQRSNESNRRRKRGRRDRDRARRRRERENRDDSWYFPVDSDEELPWMPARSRQVTFPTNVIDRDRYTNITPAQSREYHRGGQGRQAEVNGNNPGPSVQPLSPLVIQSNRPHTVSWDNQNYRITVEPSTSNQPNFSVYNRISRNDNENFDTDGSYDQAWITTRIPVSQPASQVRSPANQTSNRSNLPNDSNPDVAFNPARSLENRLRTGPSPSGTPSQLSGGSRVPNTRGSNSIQPGTPSSNADDNLIPNGSSGNLGEDNSDSERWYSDNNSQRERDSRRSSRRQHQIRRGNYRVGVTPTYTVNQNDTTIPMSTVAQLHRSEYNIQDQNGTTVSPQTGQGNHINTDPSVILRQNIEMNPAARFEAAYRRQEERNARSRWRERQRRRQRRDGQRRRQDRNRQRYRRLTSSGSIESMDSYDSDDEMSVSPQRRRTFADERYQQDNTSSEADPSRSRSRGPDDYPRGPPPNTDRMSIDYFADDDDDSHDDDDDDHDDYDWWEQVLRNYKDPADSQTLLGEFIREVAIGRVIVSRVRKRITKQYFRRGDFQLALADFRSINPEHTRQVIGVGFTGTVANAYRMTVKQNSSFGKPTLEIRPMNRRVRRKKIHVCYKIRYFSRRRPNESQQAASGPSPIQNIQPIGVIPIPPPPPPPLFPIERPHRPAPRHSNDFFL